MLFECISDARAWRDGLAATKAAMEVVMKQMAIELDDERRKGAPQSPQPARTGRRSPSSPSAAAREAEVVLLRRQLQEERLARRAAARAAQQTEERLQLRVAELEAMLGEAICDVIDASQINQTAWDDEDAPCSGVDGPGPFWLFRVSGSEAGGADGIG